MRIEADFGTLMRQAPATIALYLGEARKAIDAEFGEGYAKKNPDLLAAFVKASAQDFHSASMGVAAQHVADAIDRVSETAQAISDALTAE